MWRDKLKTINFHINAISAEEKPFIEIKGKSIPIQLISNKLIYWKLINEIKIPAVTKDKWIQEFNLTNDTWEKYLKFRQLYETPRYGPFNTNSYLT